GVVGVGDGENDQAFLAACGCGAAVGNAVPQLLAAADLVVPEPNGAGVRAIAAALVRDDLASCAAALGRHARPRPPRAR
ncbi:MAG TPA: HAD hydrolase family protein, partial [Polyangia bacterium]